jgi:hypothetical protein
MTAKGHTYEKPKITLEQALASRFELGGITYAVRSCPVSVLKHLVESKTAGTKCNELMELSALLEEDAGEVIRWYCLETLMRYKVSIPFVA